MNLRTFLLILLAPLQFVTARFHELSGLGRTVGDMATDAPTPATPAGYAFLIWILIFALLSACAAYQARASQRGSVLWQRIGWPLVLATVATNAWMLTAILHGNGLTLLAIIIVLAGASYTALGRAVATIGTQVPATPVLTRLVLPTLAILAGWVTLASFLNLAGTLQIVAGIPTGSLLGAVGTITAATLAGGFILAGLRRQPFAAIPYAYALLWGLLGIAVANSNPALSPIGVSSLAVAITSLTAALAVVILLGLQLRKHPAA